MLCPGLHSSFRMVSLRSGRQPYWITLSAVRAIIFPSRESADHSPSAVVLAPFFVHLEILFKLGYKPALHEEIKHQIEVEISKIRKQESQKQK